MESAMKAVKDCASPVKGGYTKIVLQIVLQMLVAMKCSVLFVFVLISLCLHLQYNHSYWLAVLLRKTRFSRCTSWLRYIWETSQPRLALNKAHSIMKHNPQTWNRSMSEVESKVRTLVDNWYRQMYERTIIGTGAHRYRGSIIYTHTRPSQACSSSS